MSDEIWAEFTGNSPGRPQHPDVDRLSEIILMMDGRISPDNPDEVNADEFIKTLGECNVNGRALSWIALQRSMRACNIDNPLDALVRGSDLMTMSGAWLDGFVAGALFTAKYGSQRA